MDTHVGFAAVQPRNGIYSMTWSFSGPDGRATFHLERGDQGDTVLVWRRIGSHAVDASLV